MRKQIAVGLIAGVVALASTVFAPSEAQARGNALQQQLLMQMYMQNLAAQQNSQANFAQQQWDIAHNLNGYNQGQNLNGYGYNPYLNANQSCNNQYTSNGFGGCGANHHHRHNWQNQNGLLGSARNFLNGNGYNGYYNNGYYNNGPNFNNSAVGRLLSRVF